MPHKPGPGAPGPDAEGAPLLPGMGPAGGQAASGSIPHAVAHIESDTSHKFSPSKLDTYRECPRRYRYRYVDGLHRRTETIETLVGTCVHKALEQLYAGLLHGREFSLEETLAVFDKEWAAGWSDKVLNRHKEYGPEHHQAAGRDCVRSYYEAYAPFRQAVTLAVEKRLGFPLQADGETMRIEGLVDRLAVTPRGVYEIHDYKTTARLPAQAELDEDWQLAIYDMAVRENWPEAREVELVWHFVRFGRSMSSRRTPQQLADLRRDLVSLIGRIKRDHEFLPRRSALCDWCEYRDICPLWERAEALKTMSVAKQRQDEGVRLVEQYAALEAKKRELRDQGREIDVLLRGLEEKIAAYAAAHGLESLAGREGEITIAHKDDYHVPTRTHAPELYAAIETELRGTPLWQKAAHIDLHRLLEGYRRREWDAEEMRIIEDIVARHGPRIELVRKAVLRFHHKKEEETE